MCSRLSAMIRFSKRFHRVNIGSAFVDLAKSALLPLAFRTLFKLGLGAVIRIEWISKADLQTTNRLLE